MSRRVVMHLNQWTQTRETVEAFLAQAAELGVGKRGKMTYAVDADGRPCLYFEIPEVASEALEKRQRPKSPTKAQEAVREQLEGRRRAVEAGEEVPGHLPPVARDGKVIKVRLKKAPPRGL